MLQQTIQPTSAACGTDCSAHAATPPEGGSDGGPRARHGEDTAASGNVRAVSSIQVIVPGQPQGKGRAKIVKIGGFSRMATPQKTVAYEGLVAHAAHLAMAGAPLLECAVRVSMHLWCQMPVSMTKRHRAEVADGTRRPTTKPDIDNVVKAIFDGFNGVLWRDDVQVVELQVFKHYAGDAPRVVVNVEPFVVAPGQRAQGALL